MVADKVLTAFIKDIASSYSAYGKVGGTLYPSTAKRGDDEIGVSMITLQSAGSELLKIKGDFIEAITDKMLKAKKPDIAIEAMIQNIEQDDRFFLKMLVQDQLNSNGIEYDHVTVQREDGIFDIYVAAKNNPGITPEQAGTNLFNEMDKKIYSKIDAFISPDGSNFTRKEQEAYKVVLNSLVQDGEAKLIKENPTKIDVQIGMKGVVKDLFNKLVSGGETKPEEIKPLIENIANKAGYTPIQQQELTNSVMLKMGK
jgi:hypothetical protein